MTSRLAIFLAPLFALVVAVTPPAAFAAEGPQPAEIDRQVAQTDEEYEFDSGSFESIPFLGGLFGGGSEANDLKKPAAAKFSRWMSKGDYQVHISEKMEDRQFPLIPEGRLKDGQEQYRALFFPFPDDEAFAAETYHGLSNDLTEVVSKKLGEKKGLVQISDQAFKTAGGKYVRQSTWVSKAYFGWAGALKARVEAARFATGTTYSQFIKQGHWINSAVASADGARFVLEAMVDGEAEVLLWDSTKDDPVLVGRYSALSEGTIDYEQEFTMSRDGALYAGSVSFPDKSGLHVFVRDWKGNTILAFDIPVSTNRMKDRRLSFLDELFDLTCGLALSPDGSKLAVCHKMSLPQGYSERDIYRDGEVISLYSLKTGKRIARSKRPHGFSYSRTKKGMVALHFNGRLAFSPDGRYLKVNGKARHSLWKKKEWVRKSWNSVTWILDGRTLEVVDDFGVRGLKSVVTDKDFTKAFRLLDMPERLTFGQKGNAYFAFHWWSALRIGSVNGKTRTGSISTNLETASDFLFDQSRGMAAARVSGAKGKNKRLVILGLSGNTLVALKKINLKKKLEKEEWVKTIAAVPGAKNIRLVTNKRVIDVPWPRKEWILAAQKRDKGLEMIQAGFTKEGGDLLAESHNAAPESWYKGKIYGLTELTRDADKGKRKITPLAAARVLLAMLESKKRRFENMYNFGALALKAGHPGIARQAAKRLRSLKAMTDRKKTLATLIEAGAMAQEGDLIGAYKHILAKSGSGDVNTWALWVLKKMPNAFAPLFADRAKLAFLMGTTAGKLPRPKSGIVKGPYPDLNGTIIQPVGGAPKLLKSPTPLASVPAASRPPTKTASGAPRKATVLD